MLPVSALPADADPGIERRDHVLYTTVVTLPASGRTSMQRPAPARARAATAARNGDPLGGAA